MSLTPRARERLRKYRRTKDRGAEPVYVGREDVFSLVADNAAAAADGDVEGRTICIAGPPGVGKTAFLRALAERAPGGSWGGPLMACIKIPPAHLHSPARVLAAIAWQLPKEWRPPTEALLEPLRNISGTGVSIGAAGFSFSASLERRLPENPLMPWEELPAALKRLPSGAALCLTVDEAHTLPNTPGEERHLLLQSLHMGPPPMRGGAPPPPVFAVLAGHTHTPKVLRPSISGRFADGNVDYLSALSYAESRTYAAGVLDHLGVSPRDPGRGALIDWVAGECGGFPHHLRNAMQTVAEGLLRTESLALADLDGAFVSRQLRERRERYYRARAEGPISVIAPQLGVLLDDWSRRSPPVREAQGRWELSKMLEDAPDGVRREIAEEGVVSGRGLMEEMVRRGVLMPDADGRGCRCPIDSMIGWLESGSYAGRAHFPTLAG